MIVIIIVVVVVVVDIMFHPGWYDIVEDTFSEISRDMSHLKH